MEWDESMDVSCSTVLQVYSVSEQSWHAMPIEDEGGWVMQQATRRSGQPEAAGSASPRLVHTHPRASHPVVQDSAGMARALGG